MDNNYRIWHAFQNEYWLSFYLTDGMGRIRYRRFGEGEYIETERVVRALSMENGTTALSGEPAPIWGNGIEAAPGREVRTPETYVGYRRAERFSSPERVARDSGRTYTAPARLGLNHWALSGPWEVGAESGVVREAHGNISLRFHSRDLHLVLVRQRVVSQSRFA